MYEESTRELNDLRQRNTALVRENAVSMAVSAGNYQTIQERDEEIGWLQTTIFHLKDAQRRLEADIEAERKKDETIRKQGETIMAKILKLVQVEEVHRRL